jgi:hypothetical protein
MTAARRLAAGIGAREHRDGGSDNRANGRQGGQHRCARLGLLRRGLCLTQSGRLVASDQWRGST